MTNFFIKLNYFFFSLHVEAANPNNLLTSILESGNVILLEDNQQVVEITAEQAQQLGIQQTN